METFLENGNDSGPLLMSRVGLDSHSQLGMMLWPTEGGVIDSRGEAMMRIVMGTIWPEKKLSTL